MKPWYVTTGQNGENAPFKRPKTGMRKAKVGTMKNLRWKIIVGLICLFIAGIATADIPAKRGCKILILNSYHKEFKWTDDLVCAAKQFLSSQIKNPDIYTEYMDTKRIFSDEVRPLYIIWQRLNAGRYPQSLLHYRQFKCGGSSL